MKAKLYDQIKTLVDVQAEFNDQIVPKNTPGTVVECYENPEGYAVDLSVPNANLVGELEYVNVILYPEQFAVLDVTLQITATA
ncbi:MAG: DUF4926 domain-containing protein [Scytonematopsis contorta HA4267-MV1]|nr:DUF4926 domain-containing protein [Scytonematopsis contorta HA4267-MV1]